MKVVRELQLRAVSGSAKVVLYEDGSVLLDCRDESGFPGEAEVMPEELERAMEWLSAN